MLFVLFVCFVCVGGDLVNFRGNCSLEPHPSVEYRCLVTGAIEGTRACEASEPPGTIVKPQCRRPNYYAAFPLNNMKCFDGYWDSVPRCSLECGRVTPDGKGLVVGGRRVKRGELPWHAGIYSKSKTPYVQICGGSLISNNMVLSAAHCFWGDLEKQPASQFAVAVGKLYRPWDDPIDEAQKSDVKVIHLPPRYQGALANLQDDIAVIVVAKAFHYRKYIRPVCLSFDYLFEKQQLYSGNKGTVAGWGLTAANGKPSPVLLTVDLPFVEVGTCIKNSPPEYREYITSDKICAGTLDSGSALCQGDSGGGLAFPGLVRGIERYFLRGVVSTAAISENECNTDTYTSFTSINKHETFIKEFWSETGQFKCQDGSFITAANHCDGTKECADGSDESEWACADKQCLSYLFRCNYGACVDNGARCNGVSDCADGSDESTELCLELGITPINFAPSANDTIDTKFGNQNFNTSKPEPTLTFQPGNCRLEPHPSVEYHCLVTGAIEGTRACEASEPPGTIVKPQCRRPNYYAAFPLNYMKCIDGYWNYLARCSLECGTVTPEGTERVWGGVSAKKGEIPWHAGIYSKAFNPYKQICGGSLISNKVIISAAHCFWRELQKKLPESQFAVAVGKIYRPWNDQHDDAQKSDVKEIHIPIRFQGASSNFQDDIAVVIVVDAFEYKTFIRPVCLSFDVIFKRQQLQTHNNGTVAGWGLTSANGKASPVLKVIRLPYVEVAACYYNSPPAFRPYITSDKICAGTNDGSTAICKGDGGGGLAFPTSELAVQRYYLRGVVSTAPSNNDACNLASYTSFTQIMNHEQFIKQYWTDSY